MDTVEQLYEKYLLSLQNDIARGCVSCSIKTQTLLAFYQEVVFRQSAMVNDNVTAEILLTYTANNYL
jgi:hypothetical protein